MVKKIILLISLLFVGCSAFADSYRVLYVNSERIRVGNRYIKVGDVFNDTDMIVWTSDQQAIKVLNMKNNRILICTAKSMEKKKSRSIYDYLTSTKRISTRTLLNITFDEEWQMDSKLYVLDTLYVSRPNFNARQVQSSIRIKANGFVREIPIPSDGRYYKIPRGIIERIGNSYVELDIIEYDKERDWKYMVYKDLLVELLPVLSEEQ